MKKRPRLDRSSHDNDQERIYEGRDVNEAAIERPDPDEGKWLIDNSDLSDLAIEEPNGLTPAGWGNISHYGYEWAVEEHFDEAESEYGVIVNKADGTEANGTIDNYIDHKVIIDYKTHNMSDWTVTKAQKYGKEHGQQVKEYVDSPETADDAQGWIISTVPPKSREVQDAYADAAASHDIGVKFAKGEQQEDVIEAVRDAVEESNSTGASDSNPIEEETKRDDKEDIKGTNG